MAFLLWTGFVTGLSGALLPGPLLAFTISESMKKGFIAGPLVITGHAIVEIGVVALLVVSLQNYLELIRTPVYLLGGLFLIIMSYSLININYEGQKDKKTRHGSILGGIMFSVFNPGTPIWWATAGMALLTYGMEAMGMLGLVLVVVGHWGADYGYYGLVSYSVEKKQTALLRHQRKVGVLLGGFLALLGVYFLMNAFV